MSGLLPWQLPPKHSKPLPRHTTLKSSNSFSEICFLPQTSKLPVHYWSYQLREISSDPTCWSVRVDRPNLSLRVGCLAVSLGFSWRGQSHKLDVTRQLHVFVCS